MNVGSIDQRNAASTTADRPGVGRPPLRTGDPVQVRNRFEDRWIHGFSVAASGVEGYQLRRASDGAILPAWFPPSMVRRPTD